MALTRVFITGMGALSPYGSGVAALMDGLCAGRSAVIHMGAWKDRIGDLNSLVGAPLPDPPDPRSIPRKLRRGMGPLAMMAYLAAREALEQAGVTETETVSGRMGVSFGSTLGSVQCLEDAFSHYLRTGGMNALPSGIFFQIMSHSCAANLAHAFGVNGRILSPNAACAAASVAIGLGFEAVRTGAQDMMLCGGADELHPIVTGIFDLVQAASCGFNECPEETPRPFDHRRDGTVCGEGAGALVLESEASACARGVVPLAEIVGFDISCESGHLAQPGKVSIVRCLRNALDNAGVLPDVVDYVNAHGTGTALGDAAEAQAIREVFGDEKVPVSSLKGHIGHTLGASGALELIAAVEMQRNNRLLPVRNLETPGADCEGVDYVRETRETAVRFFLKNSFALGGANAVLAIKRFPDE